MIASLLEQPLAAALKPLEINLAGRPHKADPHPLYARLRRERPVCEVRISRKQTLWLVTRYDDVLAVLKHDQLVKDRFRALSPGQIKKQPWIPSFARPLLNNMLDKDPPEHTRLRALVQKAFTPRLVEQMRPRIERLAESLIAPLCRARRINLVEDYALPIPTTIIAEMLGVPSTDRQRFHRWSQRIVQANVSTWAALAAVPALWQFMNYIRRLVALRRTQPAEDLTSALIAAEESGQRLSEDELVAMIFLLLVAGHETTVNLIANGLLTLIEHPAQQELLRQEPKWLEAAVEEMARYEGPLETATERYARSDVELAGTVIPQGAMVLAALASANRDTAHFERPDEFDITRTPNRHLSFGQGPHYCLGAPLARLEAQVAIGTLLRRTTQLELAESRQQLRWRPGLVLRGVQELPLNVTRWT